MADFQYNLHHEPEDFLIDFDRLSVSIVKQRRTEMDTHRMAPEREYESVESLKGRASNEI